MAIYLDQENPRTGGTDYGPSIARAVNWLLSRVESGEWKQPSPIGFYFARLWYYEKLYPMIFTVGALNRVRGILDDLQP
jgi:squalene-hopene/tetraprenyl-beta-curcumene cyclase